MEDYEVKKISDLTGVTLLANTDLIVLGRDGLPMLKTTLQALKNYILDTEVTNRLSQVNELFSDNIIFYQDINVVGLTSVDPKGALTTILDPKDAELTVEVLDHNLNGARLILLSQLESPPAVFEGSFFFEGENRPSIWAQGGMKYEFIWNTTINKWREVL